MLTREDDVDAHALHRRGWTISAIARHLGHDRKTIRAYLSGGRVAGQRARAEPDPFEPFDGYCRERLAEDPHLWATTLLDELVELGYDRSYPTLTRALRARGLRPACEPCRPARDRPVAVIEHPPGEEALCGIPHKHSYAEPGNMRRRPGAVCRLLGSGAVGELIESA
jgi:transposase